MMNYLSNIYWNAVTLTVSKDPWDILNNNQINNNNEVRSTVSSLYAFAQVLVLGASAITMLIAIIKYVNSGSGQDKAEAKRVFYFKIIVLAGFFALVSLLNVLRKVGQEFL